MEDQHESRSHRLMITKMVLENFKSYAGSQDIGPFHKRFSSIVGPNGSGKSNVIDALLFVFGKRAKQLRLNKVSELIHKSAGFPNLEYAKVAVHFQLIYDHEESDDDYEVVPNSQFVVSRTAYQNNQSKYTVDGKSSTYTEVGQLLRGHSIDLDNNRFLILQGEVEQIAMMKPKGQTEHEEGLLEYLEDIIGSNRFIEKIEQSSKELDEINEQRTDKVNRLKLAEKERDNLSGSKIEAETFLEKEKEIRRKKNIVYQISENIANRNTADFTERVNALNEKLVYERSKMTESEERLKVLEVEYERVKGEHTRVNKELEKSKMQCDAFERKDVKLQEDMKHTQAVIKKQQAAIAKESKKEADCATETEELTTQISKYEKLIVDYQGKRTDEEAQLEQIMASLQESTKELRASLEAKQTELAEQEKAVSALQTEKESVETTIQLTKSRSEAAAKKIVASQEKLAALQAEKVSVEENIKTWNGSDSKSLATQTKAAEAQIAQCAEEEVQLQGRIREAVSAAEMGKAALAAQQSRGGSNIVVQRLLQASKAKNGPLASAGVRGRLGDLGTIAPEFDVAVSTACGMLDFIVVDTAEGAQKCIQYLREKNLGRASFIALDQMQEWAARMDRPVDGRSPTAPRLFDLITPVDAALRPAFYMAVRDTLVAPDLDAAVKIAYVGDRAVWRVVAQDGNLIDTSGAMSGGGKETRSGGMKLSTAGGKAVKSQASAAAATAAAADDITAEQVHELEQMAKDLQAQLAECRSNKQTAEKQFKDLQKQQKALQLQVEKAKMAIARFVEQESELQHKLAELSNDADLSAAEQQELQTAEQRLSDVEAQILTVAPNLRSLQAEVASLQRQIISVGGPKLAKCQAKIDHLSTQLEEFSSSLSSKQVEIKSCAKQAEKAAAVRNKAEAEVVKAEQKLLDLITEQKEMENDALEVVTAVENAEQELAGLEVQLKSATKEYHDLKANVNKVKSVEVDLAAELEHANKELKDSKGLARNWKKQALEVRKKHIEEQRDFQGALNSVLSANAAVSATAAPSAGAGDGPAAAASEDDDAAGDVSMDISPQKQPQHGPEAEDAAEAGDDDDDNRAAVAEGLEVLPVHSEDELHHFDADDLKRDINIMEVERNRMKANVNISALLDYMRKDAAYKNRLCELEQITEARNVVRRTYEDLRRQRLEDFMAGFGVISLKLKEMYQMITLGGDAELELLDSLDPFSEGIVFSVRPPRKSWKNIANLSGGEKTLSSLALVFALHHYKPTPLYVMDEIDAALDFKNVSIVANYIKDRTKNAQFVIISLRNNMFELADRLVGIYKTHDATKSVTINPKLFENTLPATSAPPQATAAAAAVGESGKGLPSTDPRTSVPLGDATNTVNKTGATAAAAV